MERAELKTKATREAIAAAAEDLVVEDPQATFTEIAARAGVSYATIYRYFPNRAALYVALMERATSNAEDEVVSWELGPGSFHDLLHLVARQRARFHGLTAAARRGEIDEEQLSTLQARTEQLFREPLRSAKVAGRLRDEAS